MPKATNFAARYVTPYNKPLTRHCREMSDGALQETLHEEWCCVSSFEKLLSGWCWGLAYHTLGG